MKNKYGAVLGTKDNVIVEDDTITVTFDALTEVYAATLKVKEKEGTTHASKPEVKWFDDGNTYLASGGSIGGLTAGSKLGYRLTFDKERGSLYVLPEMRYHTMVEGDNTIVLELQGISVVPLKSGATVTASQLLNGKYSKVTTTRTDKNGKFSLSTYNDSTSVLVSYPDYMTATSFKSDFNDGSDLGAITLQPVTRTVISLNFTYTPSVAHGETATTENGYPDCQNMGNSLKT